MKQQDPNASFECYILPTGLYFPQRSIRYLSNNFINISFKLPPTQIIIQGFENFKAQNQENFIENINCVLQVLQGKTLKNIELAGNLLEISNKYQIFWLDYTHISNFDHNIFEKINKLNRLKHLFCNFPIKSAYNLNEILIELTEKLPLYHLNSLHFEFFLISDKTLKNSEELKIFPLKPYKKISLKTLSISFSEGIFLEIPAEPIFKIIENFLKTSEIQDFHLNFSHSQVSSLPLTSFLSTKSLFQSLISLTISLEGDNNDALDSFSGLFSWLDHENVKLKEISLKISGFFLKKEHDFLPENELQMNRNIKKLTLEIKKMRMHIDNWVLLIGFLKKFVNIQYLTLNFEETEFGYQNIDDFLKKYLISSEAQNLISLGLFFGYNCFNGDLMGILCKILSKLVNLKILVMDLGQFPESRPYINATYNKDVIFMIEKLVNLRNFAINLQGNLYYEEDFKNLEGILRDLKEKHGKLKAFKVLRHDDVFINDSKRIREEYRDILKGFLVEYDDDEGKKTGKIEELVKNGEISEKLQNLKKFLIIEKKSLQKLNINNENNDFTQKIAISNLFSANTENIYKTGIISQETPLSTVIYSSTPPFTLILKEFSLDSIENFTNFVNLVSDLIITTSFTSFSLILLSPKVNNEVLPDFAKFLTNVKIPSIFIKYGNIFDYDHKVKLNALNYSNTSIKRNIMHNNAIDSIISLLLNNPLLAGITLFMGDMTNEVQIKLRILSNTPEYLKLLLDNPDVLLMMREIHIREISANLKSNSEGDLGELSIIFFNIIFQLFLISNIYTDIPSIILKEHDFSSKLTSESFSLLLLYAKTISNINRKIIENGEISSFPDNFDKKKKFIEIPSIILKDLHMRKINSINCLNLQENPYLSTKSCKEKLLDILDHQWSVIKLRSPKEFMENEVFEVLEHENGYFHRNSRKISTFTQNFYWNIRYSIKCLELTSLDDFYGDFILKLLSRLPKVEVLLVSGLNLGDSFCENFNRFIIKEKLSLRAYRLLSLEIANNPRISNVGLKFLYVSYKNIRNFFINSKKYKILPYLMVLEKNERFEGNFIEIIKNDKNIFKNSLLNDDNYNNLEKTDKIANKEDISSEIEKNRKKVKKTQNSQTTMILNEGLGAFLINFFKFFFSSKPNYCGFCGLEVCKTCHESHNMLKSCISHYIWCKNCDLIHIKNTKFSEIHCNLDGYNVCRGFYHYLKDKSIKATQKSSLRRFIECLGEGFLGILGVLSKILSCFLLFFEKIGYLKDWFNRRIIGRIREKSENYGKYTCKYKIITFIFGRKNDKNGLIFKFNRNVLALNQTLSSKRLGSLYFFIFLSHYVIVFTLSLQYLNYSSSSWLMHYIYAGFIVISMFFEGIFTTFIIRQVNGKSDPILPEFSLFTHFMPLIQTQITRYDYYTDLLFIVVNISQNRTTIVTIAVVFLGLITVLNWVNSLVLFSSLFFQNFLPKLKEFFRKRQFRTKYSNIKKIAPSIINSEIIEQFDNNKDTFINYKKVNNKIVQESNYYINVYGKLSLMLDMKCVGECLDRLSTKNAWYFPYFGGVYIPQIISSAVGRLCFENIPGVCLQLYVLVTYERNSDNVLYYPIVISTILSLVSSFFTALQARSCLVREEDLITLSTVEGNVNKEIDE